MAKLTTLSVAALTGVIIASSIGVRRAEAFNVHNQTNFAACVVGNRGNYSDIVFPGETNNGWDLDKDITLTFYPYDGFVILENGQTYVTCNDSLTTSCYVAPHKAIYILDTTFQPHNVVASQNPDLAFTMFYVLDAPATYSLQDCS